MAVFKIQKQSTADITDAGNVKFATLHEPLYQFPLSEQEAALLVEDENHSVLQLGRQVEREVRPGEPRLRLRNLSSLHMSRKIQLRPF